MLCYHCHYCDIFLAQKGAFNDTLCTIIWLRCTIIVTTVGNVLYQKVGINDTQVIGIWIHYTFIGITLENVLNPIAGLHCTQSIIICFPYTFIVITMGNVLGHLFVFNVTLRTIITDNRKQKDVVEEFKFTVVFGLRSRTELPDTKVSGTSRGLSGTTN